MYWFFRTRVSGFESDRGGSRRFRKGSENRTGESGLITPGGGFGLPPRPQGGDPLLPNAMAQTQDCSKRLGAALVEQAIRRGDQGVGGGGQGLRDIDHCAYYLGQRRPCRTAGSTTPFRKPAGAESQARLRGRAGRTRAVLLDKEEYEQAGKLLGAKPEVLRLTNFVCVVLRGPKMNVKPRSARHEDVKKLREEKGPGISAHHRSSTLLGPLKRFSATNVQPTPQRMRPANAMAADGGIVADKTKKISVNPLYPRYQRSINPYTHLCPRSPGTARAP